MVQFAPAARAVPQLFAKPKAEALAPVIAMLEMETAVAPVLVIVTDCEALVVPTGTLPKAREVADRETAPPPPLPPVPVRETVCGEPVALSVMVMAAVMAPAVTGPKWP